MGDSLREAAGVLQAKRVVILWEEEEEPWTYLAHWFDGELTLDRLPPGTYEPVVVAELETQDFFHNERLLRATSQFFQGDSLQQWHGTPAHADLIRDFGGGSFLSIRLESQRMMGRLFAFGLRELTHDDLVLGRIVAKLILANLDQHAYVQEAQHFASSEERIRISRDLHDGVIQSLGGVGLQLEAVRALIPEDPAAARDKLQDIQRVVENDQRELRAILRELRPGEAAEMGSTLDLRLASLCQRFEYEWGAKIDLETRGLERLSGSATMDVYRMINEALANSVRHGRATAIRVEIIAVEDSVQITIADNGRGFPFRGRYELPELESFGEGPRTLKERVGSLGGSLVIESGKDGATVAAAFKLKEEIVGAD
jgi:signal transduction histidine kinase